ncbi:hypothetical protein EB796_014358 [Bugula neritina]|uniref:SCNN1D n=1 Tax=Bugula neritina TaxID=10212 RepID=A0A7J7JPG4_BUGNE|nr:hypothetical protein EB796_014358 [Bugula neritina]
MLFLVSGNAEVGAGTKSLNFKLLLSRFMDFTTSHGITHIYNAKGLMKKCFWGILTMISTVLLCLHLWSLITGYLSYDTVTNVSLREARSLVFPAVTICNNNGVQRSNMPSWMDDLVQTKFQKILNSTSESHSKNDLATAISEETSLLNDTAKMSLGYSFKDLVLICIFDGKNCDETEFWTYYHSTYGNCYTFNTGKYGPVKRSTMPGPSHGLTLVVNTGVYEYIKFLTEEAGIKVVVHDQRAMPFPNHDGLSTSPGQVNNIAVKMINTTRLDGDYGNCTRLDSNKDNMYFYPYNVSYTQWACLKTCYQKELVTQCKCFDPNMPYNSEGIVFIDLDKAQGPCRLTNSTTVNCVNRVHSRFADGTLKCSNCYQPCNEVTYDAALSTSDFPALSYVDTL